MIDIVSVDVILRRLADPALAQLRWPRKGRLAVFQLPQAYLRQLWVTAFQEAVGMARSSLESGRDVLLTCHLCYYHHKYRQFVVVANFDAIREAVTGMDPMVVTLIDDVYDTHVQLSGSGHVFPRPKSLDDPYVSGLRILSWRANEILVSASVAASLGTRHYVLAVKHPMSTLWDLLYSSKPSVYLSHPISEVRRLLSSGRHSEAEALVGGITDLTSTLSEDFVVFEPTAIDEFRFRAEPSSGPRSGNLSARWPFVADGRELIWCRPEVEEAKSNFPVGWEEDMRDPVPLSPVVGEFLETVGRQISARDHWLVEQSDAVVCFRPIYGGHESSGVRHEIEHVQRCRILGTKGPSKVLMVVPSEDLEAFPLRSFGDSMLEELVGEGTIAATADQVEQICASLTDKDVEPLVEGTLQGDPIALQRLLRRFGAEVVPEHGNEGDSLLDADPEVRRSQRAEQLATRISQVVPYFSTMPDIESCESSDEVGRILAGWRAGL